MRQNSGTEFAREAIPADTADDKRQYIEMLQGVISHLHGCAASWQQSVPIVATFHGETVWEGNVEVYAIIHPKATRCYAWSDTEGNFTAVLGIPPVSDAMYAVKVSIVKWITSTN